MQLLIFLFWMLVFFLFYTYAGYAIFVRLILLFHKKKKPVFLEQLPAITCIIACYNEEKVLTEKVNNTLALDYPPELLQIIVVDDGSTDNSAALIPNHPALRLIQHDRRKGKSAALNTALQYCTTPLIVFSDANTLLNQQALRQIVLHFSDQEVGAVAGEKRVMDHTGLGAAEGWYWRYESFLKKLEAGFYTAIGATGELFAMRRELYQPLAPQTILDDYLLSMSISLQGYRIAYEPKAYAMEYPSTQLAEEYKRKVRIATGAFQSLQMVSLSDLVAHKRLFFQVVSRRWLRWIFCPVAIPLLLLVNFLLVMMHAPILYTYLLAAQLVFYLGAFIGWRLLLKNKTRSVFHLPFYFLFMNYCMLEGFVVFLKKKQTVFWNKAERSLI